MSPVSPRSGRKTVAHSASYGNACSALLPLSRSACGLINLLCNNPGNLIYELTQVLQGTDTTESYSYDAVGNRTASLGVPSYTTNSSNELTANSNASYTYDNSGNTTSKTNSSGTTSYTWDYENRLTQAALPGQGGTVQFQYDPFGRRIEKVSPSGTTVFAYDGENVVETTDQSGAILSRFAQGQNIDEPLAESASGATDYYEADGLGSITSLTNGTGTVAQTYTYDSFGNVTHSYWKGFASDPVDTARDFDTETGLYYYRARYYDPSAGRFLSEDPASFDASIIFYSYATNNPVLWNDPLGLVKCTYSIAAHTFDCTSNDGTLHFHTDQVSSGRYKCRNNGSCQKTPFNGPIPVGHYRMGPLGQTPNPHQVPRIMLFPIDGTNTFNRSNLEVHQGWNNQSEGCITIFPPEYPNFMHFYLHDNGGTTQVMP